MRVGCVALACVSVMLCVSLQSAEARIRLTDSEILAGLLVVAGRTEHANETITLDGKFTTVSDRRHRLQGVQGVTALQVRQVRQDCTSGSDCTVACADGEIALNAVCQAGPAVLKDERQISCGSANAAPMTALCAH